MKALVLHEPGKMSVDDVPEPAPAAGEIVVAPRAVGICGTCGGFPSPRGPSC